MAIRASSISRYFLRVVTLILLTILLVILIHIRTRAGLYPAAISKHELDSDKIGDSFTQRVTMNPDSHVLDQSIENPSSEEIDGIIQQETVGSYFDRTASNVSLSNQSERTMTLSATTVSNVTMFDKLLENAIASSVTASPGLIDTTIPHATHLPVNTTGRVPPPSTIASLPSDHRFSESTVSKSAIVATTESSSVISNQMLNTTRMEASVTSTLLKVEKPLPDCLIVGVRKGGTRTLTRFLSLHPQIVTLNHEIQFFNLEERYALGENWYRLQLPTKKPGQVLIEKSAEYFHVDEVPARVYKMKQDMKIIVVLRDPFERMVSDYYFIRRYAKQYNVTYRFAELDNSLEDLIVDRNTGRMKFSHGGLHRSEYAKFLKTWRKYFPMKQILVINGDHLAKVNPAKELHKVEEFLNIEPYLNEDMFVYDPLKGYYCMKVEGCMGDEKGHKYPEFDPYFEKMVRGYFQYWNKQLYQMLGVNFGWR